MLAGIGWKKIKTLSGEQNAMQNHGHFMATCFIPFRLEVTSRPEKVKSSPLFTEQFMKIHDSYRRLGWQLPNTIVLPVLHHSSPLQ